MSPVRDRAVRQACIPVVPDTVRWIAWGLVSRANRSSPQRDWKPLAPWQCCLGGYSATDLGGRHLASPQSWSCLFAEELVGALCGNEAIGSLGKGHSLETETDHLSRPAPRVAPGQVLVFTRSLLL